MTSDLSGQTFTFPAGFSDLFAASAYQAVATSIIPYKTSGGSESAYTVGVGTTERQSWICFAVTSHNGIHGTPPARNDGSGTTATCPAITTTVDGCLLIRVVMTDQNATATTPFGAMAGWTMLDEQYGASAGGIGAFYLLQTTQGTEAAGTTTLNVSEQWAAFTFAIAPAAAAGAKAPVVRRKPSGIWTFNR
jgi:hypothetical protein